MTFVTECVKSTGGAGSRIIIPGTPLSWGSSATYTQLAWIKEDTFNAGDNIIWGNKSLGTDTTWGPTMIVAETCEITYKGSDAQNRAIYGAQAITESGEILETGWNLVGHIINTASMDGQQSAIFNGTIAQTSAQVFETPPAPNFPSPTVAKFDTFFGPYSNSASLGFYFKGRIAMAMRWTKALTSGNISSLASGTNPQTIEQSSLIDLWVVYNGQWKNLVNGAVGTMQGNVSVVTDAPSGLVSSDPLYSGLGVSAPKRIIRIIRTKRNEDEP